MSQIDDEADREYAEAVMLAGSGREIENCLELVRTRKALRRLQTQALAYQAGFVLLFVVGITMAYAMGALTCRG